MICPLLLIFCMSFFGRFLGYCIFFARTAFDRPSICGHRRRLYPCFAFLFVGIGRRASQYDLGPCVPAVNNEIFNHPFPINIFAFKLRINIKNIIHSPFKSCQTNIKGLSQDLWEGRIPSISPVVSNLLKAKSNGFNEIA